MSADETRDASATASRAGAAEPLAWTLTLVGADDPARIGRRCVLERGLALELGRGGSSFGPGGLDDDRLSRRHAIVELGERPELRDLGSHNGTQVNGRRITTATLDEGDVIGLGHTVLFVHRSPPLAPARPESLIGCGRVHAGLVDAITKIAARPTTVALLGPPGAGKSHLARVIHELGERPGPAVTVHCGGLSDARVFELFGDLGDRLAEPVGRDGTLILEDIGAAGPTLAACLIRLLDEPPSERARVIVTASAALEQSDLRRDLVGRLTRWIVHLPPLAARREDIGPFAREFVQRYLGAPRSLHPRLLVKLLRHPWPGNIRELEAVIECLCIDIDDDDGPLRLTPRIRAMLASDDAARPSAAASSSILEVDGQGRWFRLDDDARVDLGRRETLARVLAALVDARSSAPGVALSLSELLAAGWPRERVLERAGANRVHVALTTLRKLGLREVLLRRDDGYLLDPRTIVRRG